VRRRRMDLNRLDEVIHERRVTTSPVKMRVHQLIRLVFGRLFVYEKMFVFKTETKKVHFPNEKSAGLIARPAESDDIRRLQKLAKFHNGEVQQRLKAGDLCFVALSDGNLANYAWFCFSEEYINELERNIRVSAGSAYRYDVFTLPAYRGKGVFPSAFEESSKYLSQNGIKELYGLVDSSNSPMLRVYEKAGIASRKIGNVTYIRLLNRRRYVFRGTTRADDNKLLEMFSDG
jgi:GNAT superfamily N-acetyltransferase